MNSPLISITNLTKHFKGKDGPVRATDGITLSIQEGEIVGLVGESGCGKSTFGRLLASLEKPSKGNVYFEGVDIHTLSRKEKKAWRQKVQVVFQDPYASLNPRMSVFETLKEPFVIHGLSHDERTVYELLSLVHLSPSIASKFPHELSGGQRQRVGIARALALRPKLLICDEPISSLDVSVGAQILNLLKSLQKQLSLTILFISHDLRAVKYLSSKVLVMYLGKIVETSTTEALYANPMHPYTKALLSSIPIPDPLLEKSREKILLKGEVSFASETIGCVFAPRCPKATKECFIKAPKKKEEKERSWSCHLA